MQTSICQKRANFQNSIFSPLKMPPPRKCRRAECPPSLSPLSRRHWLRHPVTDFLYLTEVVIPGANMHYHTLVRTKWHLPLIRPIKESMEILLYRFSVAVIVDLPKQLGVICKLQNRVDQGSIQVIDLKKMFICLCL